MLARALGCWAAAAVAVVIAVVVVVAVSWHPGCGNDPLPPTSQVLQPDTVQPFNCNVQDAAVLDADHRYWTADPDTSRWPTVTLDLYHVDCANGGVLMVPSPTPGVVATRPPDTIVYRVRVSMTVTLVAATDPGRVSPVSKPVPVGAVEPSLCASVPNGAVGPESFVILADFDGRFWRLPDDAPAAVVQADACAQDGRYTRTADGVTYTLSVPDDIPLHPSGYAGDSDGIVGGSVLTPVPCGSSAAGVPYDGMLYTAASGAQFPSGHAPDCTRNGTMILNSTGHLTVYAPDGATWRLSEYRGPRPQARCG